MIVLGIETTTRVTSVALRRADGTLAEVEDESGRGHVEFLMPAVLRLCDEAGVSLERLDGVVVGKGPGRFTGMRVGIATAKTLAQVLGIPLVGVSGLDALAFAARDRARTICAIIDAMRGEVFSAVYSTTPDGVERTSDYRVGPAEGVARDLAEGALVAGDLAEPDVFAGVEVATDVRFPRARDLIALAVPRLERNELDEPLALEPLYVRRSDAEIKWEQRGVTIARPSRVKVPKRALDGGAR